MAPVGPELPPHLAAKRQREDDGDSDSTSASESRRRRKSPVREHTPTTKRSRVAGPTLPPAPLDERPDTSPQSDESSDDDYGPSMAAAIASSKQAASETEADAHERDEDPGQSSITKEARDEWMIVPPSHSDISGSVDPSRNRPRKFNSGKGAAASSSQDGVGAIWTETPEQKRKRLEDKVMGISTEQPSAKSQGDNSGAKRKEREETARRIREHNEKSRGKSLYDEHQKKHSAEEDDDPSQRAFDREKDMGSGNRVGHMQRKGLLNQAQNMGSRFSGGSYL